MLPQGCFVLISSVEEEKKLLAVFDVNPAKTMWVRHRSKGTRRMLSVSGVVALFGFRVLLWLAVGRLDLSTAVSFGRKPKVHREICRAVP